MAPAPPTRLLFCCRPALLSHPRIFREGNGGHCALGLGAARIRRDVAGWRGDEGILLNWGSFPVLSTIGIYIFLFHHAAPHITLPTHLYRDIPVEAWPPFPLHSCPITAQCRRRRGQGDRHPSAPYFCPVQHDSCPFFSASLIPPGPAFAGSARMRERRGGTWRSWGLRRGYGEIRESVASSSLPSLPPISPLPTEGSWEISSPTLTLF